MKLTEKQLNILNHVVPDAQAWANHGEMRFGEEKFTPMLLEKIAKHESAYDQAVAKGNYLNRKQRDDAEAKAEQDAYDNVGYDVKRRREYPPMEDYLDGIVKGDQAQVDKYIADCLAVKQRYPKNDGGDK
tara:strand:- start:790 stop:1179 length:390 start_codon:yes stop_codon:yes gene_type:complete